jgi:hypothetical protein
MTPENSTSSCSHLAFSSMYCGTYLKVFAVMKETNEKSDEKLKRFITQDSLDLMFC